MGERQETSKKKRKEKEDYGVLSKEGMGDGYGRKKNGIEEKRNVEIDGK